MANYIDKDILMAQIDRWDESALNGTNPNCKNGNEYEAAMDIAIMVEEAPIVDVVKVVHAYWKSVGYKSARICSRCEKDEPYKFADEDADVFDYCPHCGARMDGRRRGG